MAITIKKYVDITSGLGAGAVATTRELVGRLFTNNPLIAPNSFLTFDSASAVGEYFGTSSEEYSRAVFYFSWISKNNTTPQSIQYARWVDVASAPSIFYVGNNNTSLSGQNGWTGVTNGAFGLTIDNVAKTFSSLDFSGAASLAAVAAIVESAINGSVITTKSSTTTSASDTVTMADTTGLVADMIVVGAGIPANTTIVSVDSGTDITISNNATASATVTLSYYLPTDEVWALATVTYNSLTKAFDFVGGATGNLSITVQAGESPGFDIAQTGYLGWMPQCINTNGALVPPSGAIWAEGLNAQTVVECLEASSTASNNFGSFLFLNSCNLINQDIVDAATWNDAENVLYLYTVGVTTANASTLQPLLASIGGVALTLSNIATQYPEQAPMMIEAATNYTAVNSVQNYMYQQFSLLTPSVTSTTQSTAWDAIYINYYGATQTAGQQISFYQRGFLQGASVATNIIDMTAYVNEIWLKDAAGVALINLLIGLSQIPANEQGRGQVLSALQEVINQALLNGVISVGKPLSNAQKAYITNVTNDETAWYSVQNSGYWVDCLIIEKTPNNWEADYTLIYSKDDVIRKIVGTQTLI